MAYGNRNYLFSDYDLRRVLDAQEARMREEIDAYDRNRLLNTPPDDLAEYFALKFLIEPVTLLEDQTIVTDDETKVDVSGDRNRAIFDRGRPFLIAGTKITVRVPFTGESDLFKVRPSAFSLNPPQGDLARNALFLTFTTTQPDDATLKSWHPQIMADIREHLRRIASDLEFFNSSLRDKARSYTNSRRERLLKGQNLATALGVPLQDRPDAPKTYAVDVIRPKTPPSPPPASSAPFVPEPALDDTQYERILSVIRPMALTMERDPAAFGGLDEESLRSFFLATLNAHFQGAVTAETFNASGKTDILIRVDDRNVFIAECKFWHGAKALREALDQLLFYTAWRDTKTALLLFNRQRSLSAVLERVPEVIAVHPCLKADLGRRSETEFRYRFHHQGDPNRELILTVLVFDVPKVQRRLPDDAQEPTASEATHHGRAPVGGGSAGGR